MQDRWNEEVEAAFISYVERLVAVIGHADRAEPLKDYCTGLLLPMERKSVEPLAAATRPDRVSAKHQSLLHFVGQGGWSDEALLASVREQVLPIIERDGGVEAWIIDDTSFPKKGTHSVGVARQYCGQLGKTENCQVMVSLSVATQTGSLPVAHRLFLPENWTNDAERRRRAKVPEDVVFQSKTDIALDQIKAAMAQGIPQGVVLADAGYGGGADFRKGVSELGLTYSVAIRPITNVWRPGEAPLPRPRKQRRGPWPKGQKIPEHAHQPVQVKALALELPDSAWCTISWREGSNACLTERFALLRVCCANGDGIRADASAEEWLLIEWPENEPEPTRFWLSTLPADISPTELVRLTKLRWRIERDYLDLKQECGLGHYEGRGWRGFHHHISLSIAAYGFLISQMGAIPPSEHHNPLSRQKHHFSSGDKQRSASHTPAATYARVHRNHPSPPEHRNHTPPVSVSMLPKSKWNDPILMTQ
jgi:SRSO17 transposase